MNYSDPNQAEWALQNPATSGEVLAAIAQAHPALRDRVVTHPNAYPQLVTWIAAQSTSAASASAPPQSGPGPSYGPAAPQPYGQPSYGPAQQQSYGPAQPYPMQPSGPGQPYYDPAGGYPAGAPAKKKTGLVLGLVGGGVVVVAVVAVLGLFVFDWFGGSSGPGPSASSGPASSGSASSRPASSGSASSGPGPTLTKGQVEAFLDSDFMRDISDGADVDDYSYNNYDYKDGDITIPQGCEDLFANMVKGADDWSFYDVIVTRPAKRISPDSFIDAATGCALYEDDEFEEYSIHEQAGGWWVKDPAADDVTFVYGNVWLEVQPNRWSDNEIRELFKDFAKAVDAAAK